MADVFRFVSFLLDPANRRLLRDGVPVELNARYFDALVLLVREQGRLVSKDRFLDEIWRGVPVTDEALTQCIKTLRRQLGDSASQPRFIETVPKHGYRFIAAVEPDDAPAAPAAPADAAPANPWPAFFRTAGAGTLGGGAAGAIGGLLYGFAGASQPLQAGMGAVSVLLVLFALTLLIGLVGGAGVALGIAAAALPKARLPLASILGGAAGGLVIGALGKLVGLDAFTLLLGQSPGDITGAAEGALLGAATGLGVWLARRTRRAVAGAALAGGLVGAILPLLGGRLLVGSLDLLGRSFPDSRLRVGALGDLFGEPGFGPLAQSLTGAFEGALFCACTAAAILATRRR